VVGVVGKAPTYRRLELMLGKLLHCRHMPNWSGGVQLLTHTYSHYAQKAERYEIRIDRRTGGFSTYEHLHSTARMDEDHIVIQVDPYRVGHLQRGVAVARVELGRMLEDMCEEVGDE
jgi:hypothetical protein